MKWHTDILGDDFEACTYQAAGADGVERTATLVRHVPKGGADRPGQPVPRPLPRHAVLFLHGWSDYFFNVALAQFWTNKASSSTPWTCTTTAAACSRTRPAVTLRT